MEASNPAAEFWIDSAQSLMSSCLGSVLLNSICYLEEFSGVGTEVENTGSIWTHRSGLRFAAWKYLKHLHPNRLMEGSDCTGV